MPPRKRAVLCLAWSAPIVAFALWFWWLDASGQAELAAAKARLRAAGLPTSVEQIQPPFVPDADNAAPLVARFSVTLSPVLQKFVNDSGFTPTPKEKTAIEDELASATVSAALALMRAAAIKPGYDTGVKYEPGKIPPSNNNHSLMLNGARLLDASRRLAIEQGRLADVAADTLTLMGLAELFAREPRLLHQRVRGVIWSMALEPLPKLNFIGGIAPDWNQRLAERLAVTDLAQGLALSLDGELMIGGEIYIGGLLNGTIDRGQIFTGKWSHLKDWPDRLKEQKFRFRGLIRSEYTDFLDLVSELRAVVAKPGVSFSAVDRGAKSAEAKIASSQILVRLVFKGSVPALLSGWKPVANVTLAQAGLALERYRAAKGEYPATLAALAPEFLPAVPTDRYTGSPLLYRRDAGGAAVWSVGPNLKDDGGTGDDLVWRAVVKSPKGN